ncbi:SRPBCC domain-containing protein [Paenibacillus sp. Marseille-P2973]|uniref:SRPBCC family protein n=1 Tax=Paenibacillus sp. Marseille-P2973 TaxID=1871032 RepID=UPI001B381D46|nr:SRPBCC domain-containing protein [Paenibacillus sp. Marseille-P2973]MBQ4899097.1 SRPBCC domain-containing protein [Paenibacillus sp. Marseille-P2973]
MADHEIMITRTFDAPRELVFNAWTQPELLAKWWGPEGYDMYVARLDLRPGGLFLGRQSSPEGYEMWGKFVYQEIAAPEKLVFVQSFSDEEGKTIRAPFSDTWPLEIINHIMLSESDEKTTLTLGGGPINATEEERTAYESMRPHIQQGLEGTFNQLAAFLTSK